MQFLSIPVAADTWVGVIAWAYLLTNAVRVFTYIHRSWRFGNAATAHARCPC